MQHFQIAKDAFMKCSKCSGEWTPPPGISLTTCPFCGDVILSHQNELRPNVIKALVSEFGESIIIKSNLASLLADKMQNYSPQLLKQLRLVIDEEIPQKLYELKTVSENERNSSIKAIALGYIDDYGIVTESAYETINYFVEALGFDKFETPAEAIKTRRERIGKFRKCISANGCCTVGVKEDGAVVVAGGLVSRQIDTSSWRDIARVSVSPNHLVGLKADGRVVATGNNYSGECETERWRDMVDIATGWSHTVGLHSDGTVVSIGDNEHGQCNTHEWFDIIAITAYSHHTIGLKKDGTVIATGENGDFQCNVQDWQGIIEISTSYYHTAGLRSDGTVVVAGDNSKGHCNTGDWSDIVAISAGRHIMGLKNDGTIAITGIETEEVKNLLKKWRDIVAISVGDRHTVALKSNGTVIVSGDNIIGQCNTDDWCYIGPASNEYHIARERAKAEIKERLNDLEKKRKLIRPYRNRIAAGETHMVKINEDGTVTTTGGNEYNQCDTQDWRDIVAVSAGESHTLGLRKDGTVMAVGKNDSNQCNTQDWSNIIRIATGLSQSAGLAKDGTVVYAGNDESIPSTIAEWSEIIDISIGEYNVVGLKADGSIVMTKQKEIDYEHNWRDIVEISVSAYYSSNLYGLKANGTVIASYPHSSGDCFVYNWTGIVAISAGASHVVGLKSDGTVTATGKNDYGRCNTQDWQDIMAISTYNSFTVGMAEDGRILRCGRNEEKRQREMITCSDCGAVIESGKGRCSKCQEARDKIFDW
jgi:alpha-tubulin suppressor-like RCC1 family protein